MSATIFDKEAWDSIEERCIALRDKELGRKSKKEIEWDERKLEQIRRRRNSAAERREAKRWAEIRDREKLIEAELVRLTGEGGMTLLERTPSPWERVSYIQFDRDGNIHVPNDESFSVRYEHWLDPERPCDFEMRSL